MELNEFQRLAQVTAGVRTDRDQIAYCALGLAGEAGEVVDIAKKWFGQGHPLDLGKVKNELGDVLWYISALACSLDISLEEIATANVEKLRKRYPNGFSVEASLNR